MFVRLLISLPGDSQMLLLIVYVKTGFSKGRLGTWTHNKGGFFLKRFYYVLNSSIYARNTRILKFFIIY